MNNYIKPTYYISLWYIYIYNQPILSDGKWYLDLFEREGIDPSNGSPMAIGYHLKNQRERDFSKRWMVFVAWSSLLSDKLDHEKMMLANGIYCGTLSLSL